MLYQGDELKQTVELTLNDLSAINIALGVWLERRAHLPGIAPGRVKQTARLWARTHLMIQDLEEQQRA